MGIGSHYLFMIFDPDSVQQAYGMLLTPIEALPPFSFKHFAWNGFYQLSSNG